MNFVPLLIFLYESDILLLSNLYNIWVGDKMHKLILKNIGPIKECEMDIDDFTVLTGSQASGKSTIAKAIFFFRTIKDDIYDAIIKQNVNNSELRLKNQILRQLRSKFLQIFGTSRAMDNNLRMIYQYSDMTEIIIHLRLAETAEYISPNYVYFEFSNNIEFFIKEVEKQNISDVNKLKENLKVLFNDNFETIFIPAGRSLITLLTTQLNYIFTIMDEEQKKTIDFCTQKYIERILKIRPVFDNGIHGYMDTKHFTSINPINKKIAKKCIDLIDVILKGKYMFQSGEERLVLDNDRFVKINYTSSGQQETVWIFNILMYQILNNAKTYIILEEPEAHLYPDAQKKIMELLSMFNFFGNSSLITTHSPYVLGAINNNIYAYYIAKKYNIEDQVSSIVDRERRIAQCAAYFVEHGHIMQCLDDDKLIKNEIIDGASDDINNEYDKLSDIVNRRK